MANAILVEPIPFNDTTAEGSAAGTSPRNLENDWIGVVHRGTAVGAFGNVIVDLGAPQSVDTIAFLSSNGACDVLTHKAASSFGGLGTPGYSSGLETFPAGATLPTSGRMHSLWMIPSVQNYRWWQFELSIPGGTPFEAGRLVMGQKIQLARNFSFGAAFGVRDGGGGDFNANGVWLPKPGAKLRTLGISFPRVTPDESETILRPLAERIGNGKFVLLVTNPDPNTNRQSRMYFGPLVGNIEALWQTAAGFEHRLNLVSVI
jgi:hypothetical protein